MYSIVLWGQRTQPGGRLEIHGALRERAPSTVLYLALAKEKVKIKGWKV